MGRVEGKVAFITGAGRGQGRSHAVCLAAEGADIVAVDVCQNAPTVPYALASADDLAVTAKEVEALGRRIITAEADVRDTAALARVAERAMAEFGRLDIVCANAGIWSGGMLLDLSEETWQEMIDVNLTGVWKTIKATVPHIVAGGKGGSVILTSSAGGLRGYHSTGHYSAAKHGVVGIMRTLALELAPHMIRVNSLHPGSVGTDMILNDFARDYFLAGSEDSSVEAFATNAQAHNVLPIPWVKPRDISEAVVYLASDAARYVTGVTLPIDAGNLLK